MASEEERVAEFWADVAITEGYYAQEHAVDCTHAPEDPCPFAGTQQDWEEQLQFALNEKGGKVVGGPRIRDGHKVYWVGLPIPKEFNVSLHNDGYWVAAYIMETSVETEKDVPYTTRVVHEGVSKNKNIAIRRLIALVDAMVRSMFGVTPITIAVEPIGGLWPIPPGTIPGDTIFPQ